MQRILVLGGTRFIGRVFLEALAQTTMSYELTLFHRGKSGADLFPEARRVYGDRETTDIEQVTGTHWDYVVDFSAYYPNSLRHFLQKSKGMIRRLIFISTVSVYDIEKMAALPADENAPLLDCTDEQRTDTSMFTYGNRKVACERELLEMTDLDKIILRPSVVFGKYDYINRHLYWLHRAATQPRILLPDGGVQTDNYTFVEDLAQLIIKAMQHKGSHRTIYNATTEPVHSLRQLVEEANTYLGTSPELISLSHEQLLQRGFDTQNERISLFWSGLNFGFDHQRAIDDFKIQYCSLKENTAKTIDYYRSINWAGMDEIEKRYLSEKREQELLALGR